jgi:hypothetical protein
MIDLRPQPNGYDGTQYLALRGLGEAVDGQTLKVSLGESVVCGRSRFCQWSLKRTPLYLKTQGRKRDELRDSLAWRSTSRRHVRVTYVSADMVEVENLSPNGTMVDGHRVDRIVLTDCRTKSHAIQLGPKGITLELAPGALPI